MKQPYDESAFCHFFIPLAYMGLEKQPPMLSPNPKKVHSGPLLHYFAYFFNYDFLT